MTQSPVTTTRSNQEVTVHGEHIGYQFAPTRPGYRTVHTRVFNIHRERNQFDEEIEVGQINWHDRHNVPVVALIIGYQYWDTTPTEGANS